ncbi:Dihydromethanophenazine:CoB--CoM heterodisulfide reductase subunit D [Candidatus Lokiarchaeum ossiferum]|uniref:Dihydromethanophenazine:CoB--CoM heterodisulfide reductase subunit D n=1 Tax=Candidatus Lokiarchaeum ossiferum TaxID=2951803 RepID=A0ABY6HWK4_9ARCH|nr:Dihydromethanophenazine:CoB--CoM heterodisulfide reductase subunit D [Candidatus Lokiarchaeum sp. B-35]
MEIFKKFKKYSWMIPIFKTVSKEDRNNFIDGYKNRKKFYTVDNIDANLKDMAKCALCPNMCRFDCPAVQVTKKEPYAPASKARISYFMGMQHIPMGESSAIDTLYQCMGCNACLQWCPMDISTGDFLVEMRAELEKRDLLPQSVQPLKQRIESNGSVFEISPFSEESDFNHNDPNPEVFYYIGCMDMKYAPHAIRATMGLLEMMGVKYCTHLESRECCGGPVNKAGHRSVAVGLSERNQVLLKESKVKTIISTCPGCTGTIKKTYTSLGHPVKAEVLPAIQYFLNKIDEGSLKLTQTIDKTITYHDPCLLARKNNEINFVDGTRELIGKIPGVQLKEAYLHGDETRCCGMGGAYQISNPEFSSKVREDRLIQLEKYSPNYVVSACPTCEYAFKKAQEQLKNYTSEVKDLVEIIADAAGVKY